MISYFDLVKKGERNLKEAGIEEFKNDAFLLFEYVFEMKRAEFFLKANDIVSDENKEIKYLELIDIRKKRIPLQHITGVQEFMGIEFRVSEHTLIPRQDTEILVEKAIELGKDIKKDNIKILDMCTGSGCIGISIGLNIPKAQVTGVDIGEDTIKVAEENKELNKVKNIRFIISDLFNELGSEKYDMIVSNPPYIRSDEIENLMEEVKIYEPLRALDGLEDGLHFYREITKKSLEYLEEHGILLFEIGHDQGESVSDIMKENGFKNISVIKDLPGMDRVVTGNL